MSSFVLVLILQALLVSVYGGFSGNVLRGAGVTCTASTEDSGYPCEKVFDGNYSPGRHGAWASAGEDSGAWLELQLPAETVITSIAVWNRCILPDQYSGATFIFSDGVAYSADFECDGSRSSTNGELARNCVGQYKNELSLRDVRTTFIRLEFRDTCNRAGHSGLREIEVHGYRDILSEPGVACTASSENYACENVFDGNMSPGISGAWSADSHESDSWLEIQLPRETTLTNIAFWSRCVDVDQYTGADVVFSNGQTISMDFPCDGAEFPANGELIENCEGQGKSKFPVDNVRTSFILLAFREKCRSGGYGGFREIHVKGF